MRVAVVGATGAVGSTILEVMRERAFPADEVVPFASERSAGQDDRVGRRRAHGRRRSSDESIQGFDLALFSAGSGTSEEWAPRFAERRRGRGRQLVASGGCTTTCRSSSPRSTRRRSRSHNGIVANPNCSTMQMVVALKPILDAAGIERIVMSSYQSVSGTGKNAVDELNAQTKAIANGEEPPAPSVYPHQIAFNVAAAGREVQGRRRLHDRGAQGDGRDAQDPRPRGHRHLGHLRARAGAGRPLGVGERPDARAALARGVPRAAGRRAERRRRRRPGDGLYPLAIDVAGRDDVLVGRIRRDPSHERCLNLWIVGDNLRKGAATNAVQLAELIRESLTRPLRSLG